MIRYLWAIALLCSVACARPVTGPFGETLTLAVRADVTGIYPNPPVVSEAFTVDTNRNLFDTLMRFDSRLRLRPSLAERWENPNENTYLFDLRPELRFSDGRPLTARDVAASLQAAIKRHWITYDFLSAVESARALSDRRLEIRTQFPYFTLLNRLAWGFVLPADRIDATPVPVIGSGPYRLERWTPGREIVFARNPRYWGKIPAFERVRYIVVPDDHQRIERVLAGNADVADAIPLNELERLERSPKVRVVANPGLRVVFLAMRFDTRPFSDARVREAIDLAIDREELVRRVFAGRAQVATQLVPPAIFGHNPSLVATRPDRARARTLLAESGVLRGAALPLSLHGTVNRYLNDREMLAEIARQLGDVGLRVEVVGLDKREFFPILDQRGFPFFLLGWYCASGDAGDVLDNFLHSRKGTFGALNSLALTDAELDRWIEAGNRSRRESDRRQALQAALARVAVARPVLPLVVQTETLLISKRIEWEPPFDLTLRPAEMRPAKH